MAELDGDHHAALLQFAAVIIAAAMLSTSGRRRRGADLICGFFPDYITKRGRLGSNAEKGSQ